MSNNTTSSGAPAGPSFFLWFKLSSDGVCTQPRSRTLSAASESQAIQLLRREWPHAVDIEVSLASDRAPAAPPDASIGDRTEPSMPVSRV